MLVFGCYITDQNAYDSVARQWLSKLPTDEKVIVENSDESSVAVGYNAILDAYKGNASVEAIVLFKQDLFISDTEVVQKIRRVLINEDVAVVGLEGGRNISSIAWWEGERCGYLPDDVNRVRNGSGVQHVDVVDGSFLILSKWAVDNVRFDAAISHSFDGIVQDFCMQVSAAGKSIAVDDIDALTLDVNRYGAIEEFRAADANFRSKWQHTLKPFSESELGTRLDLGGGSVAPAGWINLDPSHGEGEFKRYAQIVPWPIPDDHIRVIWAHHVLEHIPAGGERIDVMNEAWRVMVPGGRFEIRLPMFPLWTAIADPTHVSYWVPQSFHYFTGELGAEADYGIKFWELESLVVCDEWELQAVMRKPLTPA